MHPWEREKIERFWAKVNKTETCWLWTASRNSRGYGQINHNGKKVLAHRFVLFLTYGKWPTQLALHHCDTPLCVNPKHLFEGTAKDNVQDAIRKGRAVALNASKPQCQPGYAPSRVLNIEIARKIRKEYPLIKSRRIIADKYKTSVATISQIINNKTWREDARPYIPRSNS